MRDNLRGDGPGEFAWQALGLIRLINGGLALLAPRWLAGRLGITAQSQPAVLYVFRMFGIRTVLIGADLWLNPGQRHRSLRQGILIHASDTTAALIATLFGELPVRSGITAVAISFVNTVLAVAASRATAPRQ